MDQDERRYYNRSVSARRSARKARTAVLREYGYDTEKVRDAAIESGIVKETSYSTVRCGYIYSYSGHGCIEVDGKQFEVTGRRPSGSASHVSRMGYIEIIPVG